MKEYSICTACNVKTYDWKKHCETKRHIKAFEYCKKNVMYASKELFDSHHITRFIPPLQFLPKVKFDISRFKMKKRKVR